MSKIFKPRRGKASTMRGVKSSTVLAAGEMFIELPDSGAGTGACKMMIGDGVTPYSGLKYAMGGDIAGTEISGSITEDTSTNTTDALANVTTGRSLGAIIGSLRRACQLNASAISELNDDVDNRYPIGSVYLSINNTNPSIYFGGTWELLSGGYVLKTITSGNGGVASNASATGGPSNNVSGGPSNNATSAATGNTGSTTLTKDQIPAHAHTMDSSGKCTVDSQGGHTHLKNYPGWVSGYNRADFTGNAEEIFYLKEDVTKGAHTHTVPNHTHTMQNAGGGGGHTHTLNNHTHTLNNHTHTLSNHTHTTGIPANISIYAWKRTA